MTKKMKKSEADWVRAILFALCALSWLPDWPLGPVNWLRIVMPIVCAAVSVFSLVQYFKALKAER